MTLPATISVGQGAALGSLATDHGYALVKDYRLNTSTDGLKKKQWYISMTEAWRGGTNFARLLQVTLERALNVSDYGFECCSERTHLCKGGMHEEGD